MDIRLSDQVAGLTDQHLLNTQAIAGLRIDQKEPKLGFYCVVAGIGVDSHCGKKNLHLV